MSQNLSQLQASTGAGHRTEIQAKQARRAVAEHYHKYEEEDAARHGSQFAVPYIDLNMMPVAGEVVRLISQVDAELYGVAIFFKAGRIVRIGMLDTQNTKSQEFITKLAHDNRWTIKIYAVSQSSLKKAWRAYDAPLLAQFDALNLAIDSEDVAGSRAALENLRDLVDSSDDMTTTQIMQIIFAGGVAMGVSDIHIEPQEEQLRLRYRVDGMLHDIGTLPRRLYSSVINRIKIMSHMKINVRNTAQDGRMSIDMDDGSLDIRVSIIPGHYGESVVMRLLIKSGGLVELTDMGLRGLADELVKAQAAKPNGMILTTGPTGSGKTTTLYALLQYLNKPGVKIITIEDPIEYELKNVSQTQVTKDGKYTFAKGLRAIVRQDPDIILVGEIRDDETSDIAINASLTGHLVLSTIHANNAAATIPRLLELGVKPSLMAPAINLFMAQRLVRRLCEYCKEKYVPATETSSMVKRLLAVISPKADVPIPKVIEYMYRPKGCSKCNGIGYKGRVGIFEVFEITEDIEKIIVEMGTEGEIMRAAMENGMLTMTQDGILKAVEGITSMEEIWRVTAQGEFLEDLYERVMDQTLSRSLIVEDQLLQDIAPQVHSREAISAQIAQTSQKQILKTIVGAALILGAGDIHIEPENENVMVRFRIDGVLQEIGRIPTNEYPTVLADLKLLSGVKTQERHGVVDSRFSIVLDKPFGNVTDTRVDVRISFIVSGFGETIVMRLLNQSATSLDINTLGIRQQNLDKIMQAVKKPYGIIFNTGPTGSGKTTTLYSLLSHLNKPDIKIITVEDPIEYQVAGILQTQVDEKNDYTFATALRALLRQNPDIMMIGEIRDEETAQIAVQAALTGHLILSTLHTNSSAISIQRLMNMGVSSEDMATAANMFMAQRLVRKLCEYCKKSDKPTPEEKAIIKGVVDTISDKSGVTIPPITTIYRTVGCDKCSSGYKGRTVISEILVVDEEIQEMIANGELSTHIVNKAIEKGMITMTQDGIVKVLEGVTTLAEVQRITEL